MKDAAIALSVMTGADENDYATLEAESHLVKDYSESLNKSALEKARIGVAVDFFGDNAEVDHINDKAIGRMARMGAKIIPVSFSKKTQNLWAPILGPMGDAEFKGQWIPKLLLILLVWKD